MAIKRNSVDVAPVPTSVTKNAQPAKEPETKSGAEDRIESVQKIASKKNMRMWQVA